VGTGEIGSFFGVGVYRIDNADTGTPTLVGPINPVTDQGDANQSGRLSASFNFRNTSSSN
jgi:hypothetical protein